MLHLITGGSASGKSAYGEELAVNAEGRFRIYLATMHPWGEEGRERVDRHRRQRGGKGFHTIEAYCCLETVDLREEQKKHMPDPEREDPSELRKNTVVLLECMSNLVANELFEEGGSDEEILERIRRGIRHLQRGAGKVFVVTNEVFSDGVFYEEETMHYLRLLGQVNQELAAGADRVTEVVYGIPLEIKEKREGKEEREHGQ